MNDALVQIFLCYRYSKTHKRILIIDSTASGLYLPFSEFFEFTKPDAAVIPQLDESLLAYLETLETRPAELQGRIGSFKSSYSHEICASRDTVSGISTKLDFSMGANEPLLVHENFGGGKRSIEMLGFLSLRESVADEISRRLEVLPTNYASIHVRNTDLQSDYEPFLVSIAPKIAGRDVLLCSDDDKVFASALRLFGAEKTINLRRVGGFDGRPLHSLGDSVDDATKFSIVLDALTDLMAMAFSQSVYLTTSTDGHQSGFGRLGQLLNSDKPLAMQLLRRPVPLSARLYRAIHQKLSLLSWRRYGLIRSRSA